VDSKTKCNSGSGSTKQTPPNFATSAFSSYRPHAGMVSAIRDIVIARNDAGVIAV
jgi:hypothetical protein